MKTRIHPTATRLAGAFLLILLTVTGSAQRNEILPIPNVDPSTGQLIPREPVQLHPDLDGLRVDVDFDGLVLADIVTWLRQVQEFSEVNFVVSPKLLDSRSSRGIGYSVVNRAVAASPRPVDSLPITIKLRSANLRDILTAIGVASDGQVWFEVLTPRLVALVPDPAAAGAETPQPPAHMVINLRELLQVRELGLLDQAIKTINLLVSQTLDRIHNSSVMPPQLSFHQSTGVLVIVGERDAIRITMDIIQSLRPHYRQPRENRPGLESDRE